MRYTTLGRTGLDVSRIAYGTWQLGGDWGSYDEDAAVAAIQKAWDSGVTLFDTAQGYGDGEAEQVLGKALRSRLDQERDRVVVATKGGIEPGAERSRRGDRDFLRAGVEQSLGKLGVDHIDVYQVHWPDPDTPFGETAAALAELVDEGKIRHVGVSNYDVEQMREFSETFQVETLQPPYHLFRRGIEADVLPYAREQDIGVLVYSPLGSGLLTGAMDSSTTFEDDDWRAQATAFTGDAFQTNLAVVEDLKEFAGRAGRARQPARDRVDAAPARRARLHRRRPQRPQHRGQRRRGRRRAQRRRPRPDRRDRLPRRAGRGCDARGRGLTRQPSAAACSAATSSLRIFSIACIARSARARVRIGEQLVHAASGRPARTARTGP